MKKYDFSCLKDKTFPIKIYQTTTHQISRILIMVSVSFILFVVFKMEVKNDILSIVFLMTLVITNYLIYKKVISFVEHFEIYPEEIVHKWRKNNTVIKFTNIKTYYFYMNIDEAQFFSSNLDIETKDEYYLSFYGFPRELESFFKKNFPKQEKEFKPIVTVNILNKNTK
jgi:hypothetical protein